MPINAQAADCPAGVNPAGSTCETSPGKEITIGQDASYTNVGVLDNLVVDGVKLDDASAKFTNGGTFNNGAAGALNFAQGGTFINNGIFNSNVAGGIELTAAGTFTNNGVFNHNAALSYNGAGDLTFNNAGTYNVLSGTIVVNGGVFNNTGTLNIGAGTGAIADTNLTGNFSQSSTGTLKMRADWGAGAADKLVVSGTADVNGRVVANFTNITPGVLTKTFVILGAGTLNLNGVAALNTATISNSLAANNNDLELTSTLSLMGRPGTQLTGNAATMAGAINTLFTNGASIPFLTALVNIPSTAEYVRALHALGPVADARGASSTMATSGTFANQLLSCKVPGEGDAYAVIREGQCGWARVTGRRGDVGGGDNGPGATDSSIMISTGAQFKVGGPWRIGGGIGYEEGSTTNAIAKSEAQRVHLGGVVKYNPGPWLFALGLNGGWGNSDNTRFVSFGGFNSTAKSSNDTDYISGRFTTAYLMPFNGFYMKPQMEVAQTYFNRGGYSESATAGAALNVQGTSLSIWNYSPSIEVGTDMRIGNNNIVRPYGKIGGTWRDKDTMSTTASFADPALAGTSFAMVSKMDRSFLDIGSGVDVIGTDGAVLRLQFDGQYGETTTSHSGSAKFSVKF